MPFDPHNWASQLKAQPTDADPGQAEPPQSEEYPPERRGDIWEETQAQAHQANGAAHAEANGDAPRRRQITADDVAGIEDLIQIGSRVRWLWERWIPIGVLTAIAAEGGKGKTRFCADLLRRIRHGLTWPDGTAMTAPRDLLSLWVMADNHHDELVTLATTFDIAPAIRLNALKSDPFGGVSLETADELGQLDSIIQAIGPQIVIIDTVGNATEKNLSKQEDAKAFYFPLQVLARRHSCAFLCLTHLNASGSFLGRRVLEKVRLAIRIQQPHGQERRRLEVVKSNSRKPEALGMTMGDAGNDYDDRPPEETNDEPGQNSAGNSDSGAPRRGRPDNQVQACADALFELLENGRILVWKARRKLEEVGYKAGTIYNARDRLGLRQVEEDGRKWWAIENGFS